MSQVPLSGHAVVRRRRGDSTADTVPLGLSVGRWNAAFAYVYEVDFSTVTAHDTYTVSAGGATSPPFPISSASTVYRRALANSLSFYENERDGASYLRTPLRDAPGHLNDARATVYATPKVDGNGAFTGDLESLGRTVDASGGWWDAGDYLKFVETTSYVVAMMLAGIKTFPDRMGPRAPGSDFTGEARFGLAFLMRMWDQGSRTLYYQVGIGAGDKAGTVLSDHDIWRLPQADDTYGGSDPAYRYIRHRPVFESGPPGTPISPNLAGRLAADFGLCYQVFKVDDRALADQCMRDGETIFGLARTTAVGRLVTAIPYGFYPETGWRDDMELGATELSTALADGGASLAGLPRRDPVDYLRVAARYASAYIGGGPSGYGTLNLYDVAGLAHFELYRAISAAGEPTGLAVSGHGLLANLRTLLGLGVAQASRTPFGYGASWTGADSVSLGDGLSVMASEYDALSHTATFERQAQGWLDGALGANPWGVDFIVGDGLKAPDCLSHQVANISGSLRGGAPVLDGAVVEGPAAAGSRGYVRGMQRCSVSYGRFDSSKGVFRDDVQSYVTTEPAIDLTASSPLALAWLSGGR